MITFWTRPAWLLALAMSVAGAGCNGGSFLPDKFQFPSSLSFPRDDEPAAAGRADESAGSASDTAASHATEPTHATHATQPTHATGGQSMARRPSPGNAPTAYTWAELSSRGRDALSTGEYAAAESAFLSALAQTDAWEAHDVRVDTSLLNIIQLAQVLDAAGLYRQSAALVEVLIAQQQADRRADFDLAGPLMLAMAQRAQDAGDGVGAAKTARAALELDGASDPMNAQLRGQIDAIAWPTEDVAGDPQGEAQATTPPE